MSLILLKIIKTLINFKEFMILKMIHVMMKLIWIIFQKRQMDTYVNIKKQILQT